MATSGFSYGKSAAEWNVLLYLLWLGVSATPLRASRRTLCNSFKILIKIKEFIMFKRVILLGILLSLFQTLVYYILVNMLKFLEIKFVVENNRQITDEIIPYVVLIFFEIVLLQNILTSIVYRNVFTWIMFSLSGIFLIAGFFKPFAIWPSLPFCLITILILYFTIFFTKRYNKINIKPIA